MTRCSWLKQISVLLFSLVSMASFAAPTAHQIEVGQAEIFLPQAGAHATGSKMTIYNRSDKPLIINKVVGEEFKQIMLHKTKFEGGKRVMFMVKHLIIGPHQQLAMTPNTAHVMLMGFKHPLKKGELVSLTLMTNQGKVPVIARVAPMHLR
ncbi:copper chaperone PCu(A)C [Vibrio sp. CAIM 722]|uniref:Copper chaperone PCu(A)C n=1 Tax=Vibrio eleionomae TaxID=2653505 RepID=A0A7X4RV10_9VIBR|nr:copper chaperone PCu(A)C [Vibrio eleionomae]MZI94431.1 copper chaperone PCu(A)C [Vibrio eleionomae]